MRLAWFSPMPPVPTGIATVSAGLVGALDGEHEIDVFVDEPGARGSGRGRSAHDFVWMHHQRPFDLTVFQLGNSSHHDYLWPYLVRYPGLAVLHDVHLHHARAASLLRERRPDEYRAEFDFNEPGISREAAELAVAGFDSHLHYQWPFTRLVALASRMAAVHNRLSQAMLQQAAPDACVEFVRLGHGTLVSAETIGARARRARSRYGIPDDAVVFGCFGGLTPDKRIPQILAAMVAIRTYMPQAWLLLAGRAAAHYDVAADISRHRLDDRVVLTGYLETEDELTDAIAASDVTLNLRWPTAREMSGPWLRCLAAGRASVVIDLAHTATVPAIDPRRWTATSAGLAEPITVAIDIMDEDHSLRLAMRRLAADRPLRERLGAAARTWWQREHSHEAMLEDYRRILPAAAALDPPAVALPPHLRDDGSRALDRILGGFGVPVPWSKI